MKGEEGGALGARWKGAGRRKEEERRGIERERRKMRGRSERRDGGEERGRYYISLVFRDVGLLRLARAIDIPQLLKDKECRSWLLQESKDKSKLWSFVSAGAVLY